MSQPEHGIPQPPAPGYGQPPVYQQPVQQEEPARLGPLQRLVGVIFSPGETFKDINRKPTWLVPMLIAVVVSTAYFFFLTQKLEVGLGESVRKSMTEQAQQSGQPPPTPDAVAMGLKITKIGMMIGGAVGTPIAFLVISGAFALGMMLLGAQTTFKKILSVVAWTSCAVSLIAYTVSAASLMLRKPEELNEINPQNIEQVSASNLGALLSSDTSPFLRSIAGSLDIFSFWSIVLLSIGLAAIAGKRSIKTTTTGAMVVGFWLAYVVVKSALTAAFS
jgi:hypothetical protein